MKLKQIFSRDMIILVLGQVISLFGNAIVRFALPLYLLRETNSPSLFGVVTACSFLPMVVFSFLGGGIADRVNKRNIMVALDFATSLLMVGLALALEVLPLVPLLIGVLMLLYGISGAYQPSVQASLPLLVPEEGLVQANALVNMVSTLAGLLGPVVGGVLFGAFGHCPCECPVFFCLRCHGVFPSDSPQRPSPDGQSAPDREGGFGRELAFYGAGETEFPTGYSSFGAV